MQDVNLPACAGAMAAHRTPRHDLRHTFDLIGLSPARLHYDLFRRAYHCVRLAAEHYSANRYAMQATYDSETHERIGYRIWVPNAIIALRVSICFRLACEGRPMPWVA